MRTEISDAIDRVQKMIKSIIGEVIAESSLLKFALRFYQALADWEAASIEDLLINPAMNVDETSLRAIRCTHFY